MLGKVTVSIVASMLLAQSPLSMELMQNWQDSKHTTQEKHNFSQYEILSQEVCETLNIVIYQLCRIQTKLTSEEKEKFKSFYKILQETQDVAIERVKKYNLQCDRSVLYYALSAIHILESVLDDEFLALSGGYNPPENIYLFGKGLYENLS